MVGFLRGKRVLAVGLGALTCMLLLGLFQNFSDVIHTYKYTVTDIGNLGGSLQQAIPMGINKKGHVVGQSQNTKGEWHAFFWSPGIVMTDLGTLGGKESRATSINDNDEVFGESTNKKGELRFFHWVNGIMVDVGPKENGRLNFQGNESVGTVPVANGSLQQAAYWRQGKITNLGTLGGLSSAARGFNSKGVVVGEAEDTSRVVRPTMWVKNENTLEAMDLFAKVPVRNLEGRAYSVNNLGEVVGQAQTVKGNYAFVWSKNEGIQDLNNLVRESDPEFPKKSWILNRASALNDCGQIVGEGQETDVGSGRAFLLTPMVGVGDCKD